MPSALVIGSGPAAAGAAMALSAADVPVTVVDIGLRLEPERQAEVDRVASLPPARWTAEALGAISRQPVRVGGAGLPQKRRFGSDFPFRDVGQLEGVESRDGANRDVVSAAYGGFSTVWGAQVMPFPPASFGTWPVGWAAMEPHYRAVLGEIPYAAEEDDLAEVSPVLGPAAPLPPLAPRTSAVLERYRRHRLRVRRAGVLVGRARLALNAGSCVRCGLCMTGCPYDLIYSAAQTMDRLRATGRIRYEGGLIAFRVGQDAEGPFARVRDLAGGGDRLLRADRVFVACGAFGTTRLVLGSMARPPSQVSFGESAQFVLPMASLRAVPDPRSVPELTLNQFNLVVDLDEGGPGVAQIHFYPYNPAYLAALPAPLRRDWAEPLTAGLLRRLTVGLGYLPSWASPPVRATVGARTGHGLPQLVVEREDWPRVPMLERVLARLRRVAGPLDLWPAVIRPALTGGAKSYHFGGSFPHRLPGAGPGPAPTTDAVGRLPDWDRVHLVDAAVFPSVPATTFTLTVMANAHRIASEVFAGRSDYRAGTADGAAAGAAGGTDARAL